MNRKLLMAATLLLLGSPAMAQTTDTSRSNGAPSGRSQPGARGDQPSAIGGSTDKGVASNNAYGHSTGTTGKTYHGRHAGSIPRPHDAPMPGDAQGDKHQD